MSELDRRPPAWPTATILLATDLTATSDSATDKAVALAARLDMRLLIVNVLERRRLIGGGEHERVDQARAERESALLALVGRAHAAGVNAEFLVWTGDPGSLISAAAQSEDADLIVVGTRAPGRAQRMLLGSVSDQVVRNGRHPVLVVPASLGC